MGEADYEPIANLGDSMAPPPLPPPPQRLAPPPKRRHRAPEKSNETTLEDSMYSTNQPVSKLPKVKISVISKRSTGQKMCLSISVVFIVLSIIGIGGIAAMLYFDIKFSVNSILNAIGI